MKDHLPHNGKVTIVVGMALSPMTNGDLGKPAKEVLNEACDWAKKSYSARLILSNRFLIKKLGISLAEEERNYVRELGLPFKSVIIPKNPRNPLIRNTHKEAQFVVQHLRSREVTGRKSILVVANFIHMRRVVATFKKVLEGSDIELFWRSTGSEDDFGPGFVQKRFRHPLFFLCYEVVVLTYSKLKGIA